MSSERLLPGHEYGVLTDPVGSAGGAADPLGSARRSLGQEVVRLYVLCVTGLGQIVDVCRREPDLGEYLAWLPGAVSGFAWPEALVDESALRRVQEAVDANPQTVGHNAVGLLAIAHAVRFGLSIPSLDWASF